jgi:hypothetical protein
MLLMFSMHTQAGLAQEISRFGVSAQERLDLPPKRAVASAGPIQVRGAFGCIRQPQCFSEDVFGVMIREVHRLKARAPN